MKNYDRIKAVVSLDAIAHNFEEMRQNISEDTKIIAVIKADGYGHGALAIARLVQDYEYIWGFAVAAPEEALELRNAGVTKPVLILGIVFEEYFSEMIARDVRLTVCSLSMAEKLSREAVRQNREVHIHLAVDTGMSRIGFEDTEKSAEEIRVISGLKNLCIEGMFTHFARADEKDKAPAEVQLGRYLRFSELLQRKGITIPVRHCSNSAGIIRMPEANLNVVRAGITIYGIYPSAQVERDIVKLEPAMEIVSHVTFVKNIPAGTAVSYGGTFVAPKPMKIATIPAGYADGYPRSLSNKGWVLIRGKRAPILGRVCMDQFMVDVTDISGVCPGDQATLIGRDGKEEITIEEFGDLSGRFSYEFACCVSKRVPRIYIKDGKVWGEQTFFE
ncbi:MAG TPA: alanine racemase [Candidatus Blautia faecipullorum]|nr:alanine racemase [Candidatus Blautia faecipullorum]